MDPAKFIPKYLGRFLERRHMEGDLPPAGNYKIKIKVPCVAHTLQLKFYNLRLKIHNFLM